MYIIDLGMFLCVWMQSLKELVLETEGFLCCTLVSVSSQSLSLFLKCGCTLWIWWPSSSRERQAGSARVLQHRVYRRSLQGLPNEKRDLHRSVVAALWFLSSGQQVSVRCGPALRSAVEVCMEWVERVIFHVRRHRGYSLRAMFCVSLCGCSKSLNTHISWSGLILSGQTDNSPSVWRQNPPHKETTHKYVPL